MKAKCYKVTDDKRKLDKTLDQMIGELDIHLKENTDLLNPIIYIRKIPEQWQLINYVYMSYLKRYYFVTGASLTLGKELELRLHVDVLQSNAEEIKKLQCHVLRNQYKYDKYAIDNMKVVRADKKIIRKYIGDFGKETSLVLNVSGGVA